MSVADEIRACHRQRLRLNNAQIVDNYDDVDGFESSDDYNSVEHSDDYDIDYFIGDTTTETETHVSQSGVKYRSGRYPYGSGENPFQHDPHALLVRARALQEQGLSDDEIAAKLGFKTTKGVTSTSFYRSALNQAYTQDYSELLSQVDTYQKQGLSEKEIAAKMGMTYSNGDASSTLYRRAVRYAKHKERQALATQAEQLRSQGKSLNEIAKIMGYPNDSSVRTLLNQNTKSNKEKAFNVAEALKEEVDKKGAIDVGDKSEMALGISKGTLEEALWILTTENPDYVIEGIGVGQANNKAKRLTVTVLHTPEITTKELYQDTSKIKPLGDFATKDGGNTIEKLQYPTSLSSDRIKINYGDEGGITKDGTIEIRPGVADLSLGDSHYAQVRILVNGTHYLKGMAVYNDDLPEGVDVVFNTNKKSGTPMCGDKDNSVLKPIKVNEYDPNNPFGAAITAQGQVKYTDPVTGEQKLGCVNKLKEEGDWEKQELNLSSQFLSKQPMKLINNQLNATYADYADQLADIEKLENPTVRKAELLDFAGKCDAASEHLRAAALPRQKWQVILPVDELKTEEKDGYNEIYAPNFNNGEKVALVRYPHAGTFEIPICVVNNNNAAAKKKLGQAVDAVGINKEVADRLSGADFDGDTVVVIPTGGNVKIENRGVLKELKNPDGSIFDAKTAYPYHDGMKVMSKDETQKQMGIVSNLITDMTLKGAPDDQIARAVKHSMVVIDAAKHRLDYQQSEKDNGIAELKATWQEHYDSISTTDKDGGASTLLSRRKQEVLVPERKGAMKIDKETGEVSYDESGRTYKTDGNKHAVYQRPDGTWYWKNGKTGKITEVDASKVQDTPAMTKIPIMEYVTKYGNGAYDLSSGTPQENAYASYADSMRQLANQARKSYANTQDAKRDPEATKKYAAEVQSLNDKLAKAAANAPKERQAQTLVASRIKKIKEADPELDKDHEKKITARLLEEARAEVGASGKTSKNFDVTDREWEAIQNHAISSTSLRQIMRYADNTRLKQLSMPKVNKLSDAKVARIKALRAAGFTASEIADQTGVSTSTIYKIGT